MSKKKIPTRCIVIDASVAHAVGGLNSEHASGATCRDFLAAIRSICHRMAWSTAIRVEWDRHCSTFASRWLGSMVRLNKLRDVSDSEAQLHVAIQEHSNDENVTKIMLKDVHLVEAALATDSRIASRDDNARGHFSRLAAHYKKIQKILWVNPTNEKQKVVQWLEKGAPDTVSKRLHR